jgi:hypothetical protein
MATSTPWQIAAAKPPQVRKRTIYARDPYNMPWTSANPGDDGQPVRVPACGPAAAGAVPPLKELQVASVEVTLAGTNTEYGNNLGQPA